MIEISKELLSEVLNVEVTLIRDGIHNSSLRFETPNEALSRKFSPYVPRINIYELAHKCKEWALVKGYIIKSEPYDYNEDSTFSGGYFYITRVNNMYSCPNCGANKSEVQAIIDACEWILKEIKKC